MKNSVEIEIIGIYRSIEQCNENLYLISLLRDMNIGNIFSFRHLKDRLMSRKCTAAGICFIESSAKNRIPRPRYLSGSLVMNVKLLFPANNIARRWQKRIRK